MNRLALAIGVALAALPLSAASPPLLRGTYSHDCGPTDGPAFSVTLRLENGRRKLQLWGYVPLDEAVRRWPQGSDQHQMPSTIILCPASDRGNCVEATGGEFEVERVYANMMTGLVRATFAHRRPISARFSARYRPIRLSCG